MTSDTPRGPDPTARLRAQEHGRHEIDCGSRVTVIPHTDPDDPSLMGWLCPNCKHFCRPDRCPVTEVPDV
jgi:hypothetical protein